MIDKLEYTTAKFLLITFLLACPGNYVFSGSAAFDYDIAPVALKTEMLTEPLGLHADRPRFSWIVEDPASGAKQTAYRIQAAGSPERFDHPDLWDSGKVNSDQSHLVSFGGEPLQSRQRVYWRVRTWDGDERPSQWSEITFFEMGLLDPGDWTALWIEPAEYEFVESDLTSAWLDHAVLDTPGIEPLRRDSLRADSLERLRATRPLTVARKSFNISEKPREARLYLSALGFADVYINGEAIADEWNTPAPTHYKIAARYKVFDISGFLRAGENSIAVELAAGKYNELPGNHVRPYGDRPVLKLQIEYREDGRHEVVRTDESWKIGYDPRSPLFDFWAGSVVDGSQADARSPDFDDRAWPAAVLSPDDEFKQILPMLIPAEKTMENLRPVKKWQAADGVWVFDFGRTVVGRVQLDLPAEERGTYIIRYSDSLRNTYGAEYEQGLARPAYPNLDVAESAISLGLKRRGNILFRNVQGRSYFTAVPTDVFTTPASGAVRFEPRSGMVPFRYMEAIGFDGQPAAGTVSANIAHTALERTGAFESSDESLNRIHEAIARTLRYNAHGFYYDNNGAEKGFWPHTYGMNLPHFAFNYDIGAYTTYILEEVEVFTREEGFTCTSLSGRRGENEAAKFSFLSDSDYHVKLPYLHYLYTGDRAPMEQQLDLFNLFVHEWWFADNFPTLFITDHYGDHTAGTANHGVPESAFLNPPLRGGRSVNHNNVASELLATVYGTHLLDLAAVISDLTGDPDAADERRAKRDEIREAVREKYYWNEEYGYSVDSRSAQGANAAMIFYEAAPESEFPGLVRAIREDIERWNNHISTGSRLTYALFSVLSQNGFIDEVVDKLTTQRYPSFLSMLAYADTLSESWPLPDGSPAITSHCQTEGYTEIGKWFWTDLQGIMPDLTSPGFKHFFLQPLFPEKLDAVASSFQSPYGTVSNEWKRDGETIVWNVTVPWNTSATVLLPDFKTSRISLNGDPMDGHEFTIDSGSWEIRFSVASD